MATQTLKSTTKMWQVVLKKKKNLLKCTDKWEFFFFLVFWTNILCETKLR